MRILLISILFVFASTTCKAQTEFTDTLSVSTDYLLGSATMLHVAPATFTIDTTEYIVAYFADDSTVRWEAVTLYRVGFRSNYIIFSDWGEEYFVNEDGAPWKKRDNILMWIHRGETQ